MTADELYNREERIAIMTICGGCGEFEAQRYCDGRPDIYGVVDCDGEQLSLLQGG